jgi:Predicted phosphatase/phosphohexomutase
MTELNNGIQNGAQEVSKLMLKAVFWDMDGTLIDSEPYWHEGELKIAADHGGYWDEDLAWQGSGRRFRTWPAAWWSTAASCR